MDTGFQVFDGGVKARHPISLHLQPDMSLFRLVVLEHCQRLRA